MMEFGVVVVGVDSKDKYTKKEENVSNHEHLQFNHNTDHHHTRQTPCAALSMLNDTYILPSPKEPRSSIHAQRRRRRRRDVVWS